ncbi:MAG TPA: universal stress protein [Cytophagaceae bacterium]|jgi:nucleotide-binding universal stress UspA family protein
MNQIKILVPTDFTPNAYNSLDYALYLAKELDAELILVHQITYKDANFISLTATEEENTKRYNSANLNLQKSQKYVKERQPDINLKLVLNTGPLKYIIEEVIKSKVDYIVVATPGETGLKSIILGSYTADVISNSPCPVFTVPSVASFKKIENILCATDFHKSEIHSINELITLASTFGASITFCNVNPDKEKQTSKFEKFQTRIKDIAGIETLEYFLCNSEEIVPSIEGYVSEKKPDIIVTLGKKRQLFERIFGQQVTKKLSLHTHIPLLSFPVSETE